jgi:predicted RNA binding protein YcfA (HicA-like mRNA interferase family)
LRNNSKYTIFAKSDNNTTHQAMKKYKVGNVLEMLKNDGWYLDRQKGSHRQFKHPTKSGIVTVNGQPNEVLSQFLLNNIFKQAGWR